MIDASDALLLPRAQLTEDERKAADAMETAIEAHVHLTMQRGGTSAFHTAENNQNVVAEVNWRLVRANWSPEWHAKMVRGQFSDQMTCVGYQLTMRPTQEAYRAADARAKH